MAQPAPPPQHAQPVRYFPAVWTLSRVLMVVAFACFLIAALIASGAVTWSVPYWGWGFGGFASACLSWALA